MLVPSIIKFAMISFFSTLINTVISMSTVWQLAKAHPLTHLLIQYCFLKNFPFTDANPSLTDNTTFPKSKMDTLALIRSDVN